MTVFRPSPGSRCQYSLRAGVLVLVSLLGGAGNFFSVSFAAAAARTSAFPEEEDHSSKDRAALVAAAQPSRKGAIRPHGPRPVRTARAGHHFGPSPIPATSLAHRSLTGAGIFQHC